ncbi:type II secretion system protein [Lysinibacillus yapensis]|uniref:Type II secretion system protein n=2 Tax=Ureibacillus yapensis TaxID=2304605 RepID=A0A396SFD6_9BACL|nr:type II secretion system protein [Lysinibacillus yapensis]
MKKRIKNEKGLTLIELLAVIVILAIVSAIAIPAIGNIIDNSRYNAVKADAINVINAAQLYYTDNPTETTAVNVTKLKSEKYLESAGKIPVASTVSTTNPRELTTIAITYTSGKTVTFGAASIDEINADNQKGSADGNKTISGS